MKLRRLDIEVFNRLATETGLGDRAREMAAAVLVDGRKQTDVAAEYGMTKQRIGLAVASIEKAYFDGKIGVVGTGIVSVELDLPESLALQLAHFNEMFQKCRNKSDRKRAIANVIANLESAGQSLAG